ncbi:inner membrane protein [Lactobacillus colini]|uniref:Inner membrane protein n=1 Tax=Lactobacillus colini TaxID=1819254 RepID=A0ABS4ME21_9LACO|nr:metal-dependent hydrolase [Lactobacillus colini]MBP2057938.1 inner membrane protein [Lactobacillus colini]
MLARAHCICSIAIAEAGLFATNHLIENKPIPLLIMLAATGVGALLPDVDQHNSTASRNSPVNFSFFFRHRGITHTIVGWLIFSSALYYFMNYFRKVPLTLTIFRNDWGCLWLGLVVGYILHLVEDGFSRGGINWLWPLTSKPLKLWPFYKVGGKFEKFLTFLAKLAILIVSFYWIYLFLAGNYQLF